MTTRRRSSSSHPACVASGPSPTGKSWGDVASLGIKQRERVELLVWQLLFVGCLTRVLTDTSTCNSSTCSSVETLHPQLWLHEDIDYVQFVMVHFDDITFLDR